MHKNILLSMLLFSSLSALSMDQAADESKSLVSTISSAVRAHPILAGTGLVVTSLGLGLFYKVRSLIREHEHDTLLLALQMQDELGVTMCLNPYDLRPVVRNVDRTKASKQRVLTALCVFKSYNVPADMRMEILSHLPEDVISKNQCRLLLNKVVTGKNINVEVLVEQCPFEWFRDICSRTDSSAQGLLVEKLAPLITQWQLMRLKNELKEVSKRDYNIQDMYSEKIENEVRAQLVCGAPVQKSTKLFNF